MSHLTLSRKKKVELSIESDRIEKIKCKHEFVKYFCYESSFCTCVGDTQRWLDGIQVLVHKVVGWIPKRSGCTMTAVERENKDTFQCVREVEGCAQARDDRKSPVLYLFCRPSVSAPLLIFLTCWNASFSKFQLAQLSALNAKTFALYALVVQ